MDRELSDTEKSLMTRLKTILQFKDLVMGVMLAAIIYGLTDDIISYLDSHPDATSDQIIDYVAEICPEDDE